MRTVCDGVLGVIGRRCRTGHGVLRSTRVASECGGLCMGSESRSRARWGVARAQTRAYLGAALAAAARCFLGSGIGLYRCTGCISIRAGAAEQRRRQARPLVEAREVASVHGGLDCGQPVPVVLHVGEHLVAPAHIPNIISRSQSAHCSVFSFTHVASVVRALAETE